MTEIQTELRDRYWAALDNLIHCNEELIKSSDDIRQTLTTVLFSKEIGTVRVKVGRRLSTTTYIAENASCDDCVICLNARHVRDFSELRNKVRPYHQPPEILFLGNLNPGMRDHLIRPLQTYDKVWVDCSSVIKEDLTWEIYDRFASRTNQFIFLG